MSVTGAIIAGVGAAGALGGAAISSHGANQAATTQANAANEAAQLQHQDALAALNFQQQVYGNQQAEIAPYLNAGYGGLANLQYLLGQPSALPQANGVGAQASIPTGAQPAPLQAGAMPDIAERGGQLRAPEGEGGADNFINAGGLGLNPLPPAGVQPTNTASGINVPTNLSSLVNPNLGGYGSLLQPFQAPTALTETNDPGYQARLALGQQTLENSAAARGGLLSGGTAKALNQFGQDYASNEYQNVYNRAFNTFETNQANLYNRLASLSGLGQVSTAQLGSLGNAAAGNVGNILLTSGNQIGNNINNAGAARASGYVGSANAFGGALNNLGNLGSTLALLKAFGGGSQPSPIQNYDQSVGVWG